MEEACVDIILLKPRCAQRLSFCFFNQISFTTWSINSHSCHNIVSIIHQSVVSFWDGTNKLVETHQLPPPQTEQQSARQMAH